MRWYEACGLIALIFLSFALIHSLFVAGFVKDAYRRLLGKAFMKSFYRLLYTFFSVLTTGAAFLLVLRVPDELLFAAPAWLRWPMHALQLLGVYVAYRGFESFDFMEFLGVRQALGFIRKRPPGGDIEGVRESPLVTGGIYALTRNSMYLGGILVFTFNPFVTRTWLTVSVLADLYFLFGAWVERKRLLGLFGREYEEYAKHVPLIFPLPGSLIRALLGRKEGPDGN